jgi:transposase
MYSNQQRQLLLETYFKTGSYKRAREELARLYPNAHHPAKSTVKRLVDKFRAHGTISNRTNVFHTASVLTEQKITEIHVEIEKDPHISLRKLAQITEVSYGTAQAAVRKHLKMHPYKTTVVHELLPRDSESRTHFCEWMLDIINNDDTFLDRCYFTDEAWFNLSGYVNSQNSRTWSFTNPHNIVQQPLHSPKVGVWAAMSRKRIFFTFFDTTVTSEFYKTFINKLVETFSEDDIVNGWIQQDNAPSHTSAISMRHLEHFFGQRIISRDLWPPRSPDLTPPDFFLWAFLKERVYKNAPRNLEQLRANITAEILAIQPPLLQNVFKSFSNRLNMCQLVEGGHFQHL